MNRSTLAILPLFALILPFILWPIEVFVPLPFIIEELGKAALVLMLLPILDKKTKVQLCVVIGVFFALSESVLYLFNSYFLGSLAYFAQRLFLTSILHSTTTLLILLPTFKSKKLLPAGLILAMLLHYFYNVLITR